MGPRGCLCHGLMMLDQPDRAVEACPVERIVSVRDETPQVIKQRPFVAIEKTNECDSVTRLGFRNPKSLFEPGKLLLGRTCCTRIHRLFMVSRSGPTVQTF